MKKALIFPGQGSQKVGMGRELAAAYSVSKEVFEIIDDALSQNLSKLIWEGDLAQLTLTENAQPALMANSLAILAALQSEGFNLDSVDYVAGHSLGEYTALCASKAIKIADAARLLKVRGKAMQACDSEGRGAMAVILGLTSTDLNQIALEVSGEFSCQVANDNDPNQVVISGHREAVDRAINLAKQRGAKRALPLNVSAPFHSDIMKPAAEVMQDALSNVVISKPQIPVVMNTRANSVVEPESIRKFLVDQVAGMVRWRESITFMRSRGVEEFYELGEGKALSGMVKRISNIAKTINITSSENPKAIMENIYNDRTQ